MMQQTQEFFAKVNPDEIKTKDKSKDKEKEEIMEYELILE